MVMNLRLVVHISHLFDRVVKRRSILRIVINKIITKKIIIIMMRKIIQFIIYR